MKKKEDPIVAKNKTMPEADHQKLKPISIHELYKKTQQEQQQQ